MKVENGFPSYKRNVDYLLLQGVGKPQGISIYILLMFVFLNQGKEWNIL